MSSRVSSMYRPLVTMPSNGSILSKCDDAKPLFIVTGASFTPYCPYKHGEEATHVFAPKDGEKTSFHLMNTGSSTALKLIEAGHNVIVHGKDATSLISVLQASSIDLSKVRILGGDLSTKEAASELLTEITNFAQERPVDEVRLMAYQSFAQSSGTPFKIMADEDESEIIRAASRRVKFVYNMAAIGYWLLEEQGQDKLRVVAMSALAAHRPSYGLIADTTDKVTNEAMWRTFHVEANHLTGKPVNVVQINPGITTACEVYRGQDMHDFIHEEAKADGFPIQKTNNLPQLSADDVAEVIHRMLQSKIGEDTNHGLPARIVESLYAGYDPNTLREIFKNHVEIHHDGSISCGLSRMGPDHLFAAYTTYGRLPEVLPSGYQRISLTPLGQTF